MNKILFIMLLSLATASLSFGQCEKKQLLTGSKTEYLDTNGTVLRTVEEKSLIKISKSEVAVEVEGEHKMTFNILSSSCNWEAAFKTGKTLIKATLNRDGTEVQNVSLDIQGKEGKVTLVVTLEGRPDIIRVAITKFEEQL